MQNKPGDILNYGKQPFSTRFKAAFWSLNERY